MLQGAALEAAVARLDARPAEGTAYRVIPAQYHLTALSAIGSLKRGGRYNPRGRLEALYLSESPITALQEVEAIQQTSGRLIGVKVGPKTLLSVDYHLQRQVELTDERVRDVLGATLPELLEPWLLVQASSGTAPAQRLGLAFAEAGVEALRAPSSKNPSVFSFAGRSTRSGNCSYWTATGIGRDLTENPPETYSVVTYMPLR